MTRLNCCGLLVLLTSLSLCDSAVAQGRGNILFGDFKVEGGSSGELKPDLFYIILSAIEAQIVQRQPVSNGGRYRFNDVPNGQYDLIVEVEGQEVVRMRIVINELRRTDVRRDIALEWRENPSSDTTAGRGSIATLHARSAANKARFEKAQDAAKKGDAAQAISLFQQIVAEDPKDFIAWTELGTLHFKAEKLSDAEKCYMQALDLKPTFVLALLNLGKLKLQRKDFEGAVAALERAVQSQPGSADANYFLGEAYLQLKKGSKAVGPLNEALRLDPIGKADSHLRLGALYNAAGMKDKAAGEYAKFLAKKPDSPDKEKLQKYIKDNKKQ
jgi:tetratricopeptide (TPR) repeat protein